MADFWIVVGLGNPGAEYNETRHNAGFAAIDSISGGGEFKNFKNSLLLKRGNAVLVKPQTYMNLSGRAVLEVMQFYKVPLKNLVVIHDDIDLNPGDIRTKIGGSAGGHNGIKSIDSAIGSDYFRIRIGVGHPRNSEFPNMPVSDWVLQKPCENDAKLIKTASDKIPSVFNDKFDTLKL